MAADLSGESLTAENKTILLVAATTGYQTRAFAEAGRRLGIEMILATDRCHILEDPWGDRAVPLRFEQLEGESIGCLVRALESQVDGVVAVGDRPASVAARIAERLNLPFHPAAAVEAAGDKQLARECFAAAGLITPEHYLVACDGEDTGARFYPGVLKPLGLSASRGVIRADTDEEFRHAVQRIRSILASPDIQRTGERRNRVIQVERFLEGREFALEGLVTAGQLRVLALFDKPDPLNGPFFEETIYVTPTREHPAIEALLRHAAQRAVTALGLTHGPVHAEMRVTSKGVFVLEVAARPIGGLCSRALRFAGGQTLEEIILLHALQEETGVRGEALAGGVMMIPIPQSGIFESAEGVEEASRVPGISGVAITAKQGQRLQMLPEGSSYLGFIFAEGINAEESLRIAHGKLSFTIQMALPIAH